MIVATTAIVVLGCSQGGARSGGEIQAREDDGFAAARAAGDGREDVELDGGGWMWWLEVDGSGRQWSAPTPWSETGERARKRVLGWPVGRRGAGRCGWQPADTVLGCC